VGRFKLVADFKPRGDQPQAVDALAEGVDRGLPHQVLLGVTGSGKTFTLANVIERVQKPTLVIVHNKTLAAQLYREFQSFFPENAVEYFVSYYDYYQPEAYIPSTDTYIAKDASINDAIDRMRHSATSSLFERDDIIIVASVSCIYGLGSPEVYHGMLLYLEEGVEIRREAILKKLVEIQYQRNDQRTRFDLEMTRAMGYCHGIENYSRHLSGRQPGEPPPTLLDYFPKDYLLIVDESHATIPQVQGMHEGDYSRKKSLVEYGFRLPSAFDNRPLNFAEFEQCVNQAIYVSATPGPYELGQAGGRVIEQIIRPTGLMDPEISVRPAKGQVDDLLGEIKARVSRGDRVLVTTLTKRMAEDLTEYYHDLGVRVRYLHSDIDTLERTEIIRDLRRGVFDVLIGINLLREGLDIPEVSLVAILDADKEGYLRSERSLIQTAGRAARNVNGAVILYGDIMTQSMKRTIEVTTRRRSLQEEFNREHGIMPETIKKGIPKTLYEVSESDYVTVPIAAEEAPAYRFDGNLGPLLRRLEAEMKAAARELAFERAAQIRDQIKGLKRQALELGVKE